MERIERKNKIMYKNGEEEKLQSKIGTHSGGIENVVKKKGK